MTPERLMLFFEFDILRGSKVRACIAVRFPPTIWLPSDRAPSRFCRFILQRMYIFIINNTNFMNTPTIHVAFPPTYVHDSQTIAAVYGSSVCAMSNDAIQPTGLQSVLLHAQSGLLTLGTSVAFRRYSFI